MHTRYKRAAVAEGAAPVQVRSASPRGAHNCRAIKASRGQPGVLWASWAISVRAGRLVAVRLNGDSVEVALVERGADHLRWVPAASVLTERQVAQWRRMARFTA